MYANTLKWNEIDRTISSLGKENVNRGAGNRQQKDDDQDYPGVEQKKQKSLRTVF
jgi:hypothetical protein